MREGKLTARITIRFTPEELKGFEEWAQEENERKVSNLLRRLLLAQYKNRKRGPGPDSGNCDQPPRG